MSLVEAFYSIKYCSQPPFLTFNNFFTFLLNSPPSPSSCSPLTFLSFFTLFFLLLSPSPSSPSPPSPSSPLCFLPISSLPFFLFLPSIYFCPYTVFSHILSYL